MDIWFQSLEQHQEESFNYTCLVVVILNNILVCRKQIKIWRQASFSFQHRTFCSELKCNGKNVLMLVYSDWIFLQSIYLSWEEHKCWNYLFTKFLGPKSLLSFLNKFTKFWRLIAISFQHAECLRIKCKLLRNGSKKIVLFHELKGRGILYLSRGDKHRACRSWAVGSGVDPTRQVGFIPFNGSWAISMMFVISDKQKSLSQLRDLVIEGE